MIDVYLSQMLFSFVGMCFSMLPFFLHFFFLEKPNFLFINSLFLNSTFPWSSSLIVGTHLSILIKSRAFVLVIEDYGVSHINMVLQSFLLRALSPTNFNF